MLDLPSSSVASAAPSARATRKSRRETNGLRRALVIDALGGAAVTIDYRSERSMPQGARHGWRRVGLAPSGVHKALRPVSALARPWERSHSERDRMRKMPEDRPRTRRYAPAMRLPAPRTACVGRTPQREY